MMPLIAFLLACGTADPDAPQGGEPVVTDPTTGAEVPDRPSVLEVLAPSDVAVSVDSMSVRCQGDTAAVILETLGHATAVELDLLGDDAVVSVPLTLSPPAEGAVWHRFDGTVDCAAAEAGTWVARAFRDDQAVDCAVHGVDIVGVLERDYDVMLQAAGRPVVNGDCHDIRTGR